jgi:fructan beta-fructosidase
MKYPGQHIRSASREMITLAAVALVAITPLLLTTTCTNQTDCEEPLRPLFHYTADSAFLSDPNGLVWYEGEYHLFHQYNPYDIRSGVPQHWAHAVSRDLIRWERLPFAIYPHGGGNIWSGSAVVDKNNTSGLQTGEDPPIVAFYTWHKDFSQRMTYSNDGGETWTEYPENPVVAHIHGANRDPKVFWHEPSQQWIMILYVQQFEIFVSKNLKEWTNTCSLALEGFHECPDFFELPVDGNPEDTRWVVVDGAGRYYSGNFDGSVFTPEGEWHFTDWNPLRRQEATGSYKGEFYATQTWSNMPEEDGRRIQIAAMRDARYRLPQKGFHNQMTFPCELTLRTTPEGIRLFRWPVREIEQIYGKSQTWTGLDLEEGTLLVLAEGDLLDIRASLQFPPSDHEIRKHVLPWDPLSFRFTVRGIDVHYDVWQQEINCMAATAPLKLSESGELEIRILVDKSSVEIFGNRGEISISTFINPLPENHSATFDCTGGTVIIKELVVNHINIEN